MQTLDLVDFRFPALLNGEKTDTIRVNAVYYPDITLDSVVTYVTHLTPDETAKQFPQKLAEINTASQ